MIEEVILVDENDNEIGREDKLVAHQKGVLHRAISVFIFNSSGEMLLQRRALGKYHSGGLWSNTACSHPMPGESTITAAKRRLMQEMNIETELKFCFNFLYNVDFNNGLIEHELDHVFIGTYDFAPAPEPGEVMDWRWIKREDLNQLINNSPELFTEWFKICYENIYQYIN